MDSFPIEVTSRITSHVLPVNISSMSCVCKLFLEMAKNREHYAIAFRNAMEAGDMVLAHKCLDLYPTVVDVKALALASKHGDMSMMKRLVDMKVRPDEVCLYWALRCGHIDIVNFILDCVDSGRVAARSSDYFSFYLHEGRAPLIIDYVGNIPRDLCMDCNLLTLACESGHVDIVKRMIDHAMSSHHFPSNVKDYILGTLLPTVSGMEEIVGYLNEVYRDF